MVNRTDKAASPVLSGDRKKKIVLRLIGEQGKYLLQGRGRADF